jgi:hypothetical protein
VLNRLGTDMEIQSLAIDHFCFGLMDNAVEFAQIYGRERA